MLLDIIFFAILAIMTALGFCFGLFKTIVSFFGWFVSILIAYLLAKAVANALLTPSMAEKIVNGKLFDAVYGLIPDGLKEIKMSQIAEMLRQGQSDKQIFDYVRGQAGGLIGIAFTLLQGSLTKEIYLNSGIDNAGQTLALKMTYQIYVVLVGIAIFVVLRIVVMGVSIIFNKTLRGRDIHLWERLGGLALGFVRGLFCAFILTMVFGFVAGFSGKLKDQIEASAVAVPASNWINETMSKALTKSNEESDRYQNLIEALERKIEKENQSA